jgi:UDP-N-acetylmuramate--alanine ligase
VTGRFRGIERIHFVGIGGIGMSGLAELLQNQGYRVSGSDVAESAAVERLRSLGVEIAVGHDAEHARGADVVVVSSAIRAGNVEIVEAEHHGIPVIPRAEMLAELMRLKDGIAVAGTHGKTTTTSLVAHLLDAVGLDPTAVVGGRVTFGGEHRSNARLGTGPLLVAEADESDGSFLRLAPVIAVVTNVEPEHLDHYRSFDAIRDAFVSFANRVPFWGRVVLCLDDPGVQSILPRLTRRLTTYGFSAQADWVAQECSAHHRGMRFRVRRRGERLGEVELPIPGRHNVSNALAALAVADELGVPFARAAEALAGFAGVERRFETVGSVGAIRVVDDYGHHPTEIRATLAAARSIHSGRLVVVFQPHRYSRTRDLFDEFATAFHDADLLLLTEVYAAGEPKIPGVEARSLADTIEARGHRAVHFQPDLEAIPAELAPTLREGDLVLTLGAGSIGGLGPRILSALRERKA